MSVATYVRVSDGSWRFEPQQVFDALRDHYAGRSLWQGSDPRQVMAEGYADGWEVNLGKDGRTFVVKAPPTPLMELVSWVRAFVPDDVPLQIFDDQYAFEVAALRPGITPEQVRAEFYPDAWQVEQMSRAEPSTREQRRGSTKPPHLP
jgi:hypothetical protein